MSLGWAFLVGAVVGFAIGILRGWWMYGTFDMAYFYNHALGGLFIGGILCMLIVALRNWSVRNPL